MEVGGGVRRGLVTVECFRLAGDDRFAAAAAFDPDDEDDDDDEAAPERRHVMKPLERVEVRNSHRYKRKFFNFDL